jgi:hypothetical protein
MPKIHLEIHGSIETQTSIHGASSQSRQKCFSFNVPFDDSPDTKVRVEILCPPPMFEPNKTRLSTTSISAYDLGFAPIKSSCEADVSDDFLKALRSGINTEHKLPYTTLQEELKRLYYGMLNATTEALLLIKYGLHFPNISESPFQGPSTLYGLLIVLNGTTSPSLSIYGVL